MNERKLKTTYPFEYEDMQTLIWHKVELSDERILNYIKQEHEKLKKQDKENPTGIINFLEEQLDDF